MLTASNNHPSAKYVSSMSVTTSANRKARAGFLRCLLLAVLAMPLPSMADSFVVADAATDAKLYFTAPLRWDKTDWLAFGSLLFAVGAAHHYDEDVRDRYAVGAKALGGGDPHGTRDYLPLAALAGGTWGYAALTRSSAGRQESWSLVEAAALSGVTGYVLKYAAGRRRPNETVDSNAWTEGGDAFPSMHVNLTFAVATVFAESGSPRFRWLRRTIGYGAAGVVAYNRVHDNAHWLSDTVAGAALGLATARFVLNRRGDQPNGSSLVLMPIDRGLMLSYSMPLR